MGRLRDAWNVLRGYAAAQDHRASAWAPSGGSANAEVGMAAATVDRAARRDGERGAGGRSGNGVAGVVDPVRRA
jgi:hypothetical protein